MQIYEIESFVLKHNLLSSIENVIQAFTMALII
jgi:hypothetical protein